MSLLCKSCVEDGCCLYLQRNMQRYQRTAMLYIFFKFTSNLTSQQQILSKLEIPFPMGALLSGIQLLNCWHSNTLAVFHIFFFPFSSLKFLSSWEFKYIAQQTGGVLGSSLGKELSSVLRLFRENTFHQARSVSQWGKKQGFIVSNYKIVKWRKKVWMTVFFLGPDLHACSRYRSPLSSS